MLALLLWTLSAAADKPVILVFGDSLSAAYGIDAGAGWVALLQQRLVDLGYPHRVVNASVSGETTRGGLSRLPNVLHEHQPAVVMIALGGNDGLRGLPLPEMRTNLAAMVGLAHESGAQVVLAGVRLPPNYGSVYTGRFEAVYRELGKSMEVTLIPYLLEGVAERQALMQDDRLHPGPEAQTRILDNVWPRLEPLLSPPAEAEETENSASDT